MRQEFVDSADGMVGKAREHIFEPGEGVDVDALARSDETAQHSGGLATYVTAEEHPVGAADSSCFALVPLVITGPTVVIFK